MKAERRKLLEGMLARPPKVSCVISSVHLTAELQPLWGRAGDVVQVMLTFPRLLCRCSAREVGRTCSAATVRRKASLQHACPESCPPPSVPTLPLVPWLLLPQAS